MVERVDAMFDGDPSKMALGLFLEVTVVEVGTIFDRDPKKMALKVLGLFLEVTADMLEEVDAIFSDLRRGIENTRIFLDVTADMVEEIDAMFDGNSKRVALGLFLDAMAEVMEKVDASSRTSAGRGSRTRAPSWRSPRTW